MRRIVVVGLVGGVAVTALVVLRSRRGDDVGDGAATPAPGDAGPDWAPLRLVPPLAEATTAEPFVDPAADGTCPSSHPIKAKLSSGIFHEPGTRFYAVTKAQRCYLDADAATADGLRPPKS